MDQVAAVLVIVAWLFSGGVDTHSFVYETPEACAVAAYNLKEELLMNDDVEGVSWLCAVAEKAQAATRGENDEQHPTTEH